MAIYNLRLFLTLAPSRYVVGFDLGTTNSAVTYVDTAGEPWRIETFAVPQLVAPGQVEARETLPSFHYQPAAGELAAGALQCPWHRDASRTFSRGLLRPRSRRPGARPADQLGQVVAVSLGRGSDGRRCCRGTGRPTSSGSRRSRSAPAIWPTSATPGTPAFPRDPLAEQEFVLTLPASFDEVARELTVKAAALAGLPRVVLIEEPQAAFYAWIYAHADDWDRLVAPGQKILVCDIGGGTSDFTLIRVRRGEGGKVQFHRVAVGDHLILGGDNLDLALAHHIEQHVAAGRSDRDWSRGSGPCCVRTCRGVKETLLGPDAPERTHREPARLRARG